MSKRKARKPQDDDDAPVLVFRTPMQARIESAVGYVPGAMVRAQRIDELRAGFYGHACPDGVEICGDCPLVADRWATTIFSAFADCPVAKRGVVPHDEPLLIVIEEATPALPATARREPMQGDLFE